MNISWFVESGALKRSWVLGISLAATLSCAWGADYEWNFANGNLNAAVGNGVMSYADAATPGLTTFGTTDGGAVPHIAGQAAAYMRVPAFTDGANGYLLELTDSGPNGGGGYINQYTFVFDVFSPGDLNWTPFFNTNPGNGNDADFYIDPTGRIGIAALGYSDPGVVAADAWHRVAFAADLGAGTVSYYVDGVSVKDSTSGSLDGRFALYSNADPSADVLLFNEGDSSGDYTHELLVSSVYLTDRTLSAGEILALGGPAAAGIVVPEPGVMGLLMLGAALIGLRFRRR